MMDTHQDTRQRLEERLTRLIQRLHKVEGDRRRERNPLEPDWEEQAITRQNDEVLDGLDAEGHREIDMIRAALNRLDSGTYGICMTCGDPIAPARLEALPYAIQCIAQAENNRP
ncbi:TraR/DksA family transcriptional regulator [Candidatus Entotheonella palauensis]|uniref:TraR/DksA family transcriptional regulator n=1 Tax=Candidatus Entotheonella palauensis TaxID=93172 RepID=UPI000B80085C|nr:TraR/DksA family transcriptional regulator [Candidatus Entotheonella palauensis]